MSMTREEAIKILKNGGIEVCGEADRTSEFIAALDVALDALIPPTREDELEAENRELKERIVNWRKYMAPTREQVERMRGEWIDEDPPAEYYICSKCGECAVATADHGYQYRSKFCPHCGAPMTDEAVDILLERWKEALDND